MHRPFAILICAAAVLAQDKTAKPKLEARHFVPSGYRAECFVDFAALDDCGMWPALRKSVMGMMLGDVEKQLGFELAELKTLRAYPEMETAPRTEDHVDGSIVIFEGGNNVTLPPHDPNLGMEETELAGVPALTNKSNAGETWLCPRPGLLINGNRQFLEPVVAGKGQPGVPDDEFMTLLAGKDLAHVIALIGRPQINDMPAVVKSLPWVDGDLPTCFLLRMRMITPAKDKDSSDAPEPQVVLEAVVRHASGKGGAQMLQEQVARGLEFLKKHKQFGAQKRLWNKVESKIDGRDLRLSLSLGRARDTSAFFGAVMGPLFMGTLMVADPGDPAVVEETAAEPDEKQKEKGNDKPKGDKPKDEKPKETPKPDGGKGNGK